MLDVCWVCRKIRLNMDDVRKHSHSDEIHWAVGRVEYRKTTKIALRKVLAALTRLQQAYAELPDDYVRARALDICSINWPQLRKHKTTFEQDLPAKPKKTVQVCRPSQVVFRQSGLSIDA